MRYRAFAIFAGLAAFALGTATLASADDVKLKSSPSGNIIAFDNGAKFEIAREQTAGKMTFKLVDSSVKITDAPVVTLQTSEGPQEVTLIPVAGQTNTWYFTNDVIRRDRFDGTMAIVVDGKTYTQSLVAVTPGAAVPPTVPGGTALKLEPRHGGRVVTFTDCGASVEVLHDPATGSVTIYSFEDVTLNDAPVLVVNGPTSQNLTLTRLEGANGAWVIKHDTLKAKAVMGTLRIMINGKPCTTTLRGGNIVEISGGPRWEVVPMADNRYRFYVVDERIDNRPVVVERPTVVYGERTYTLTPVPGEPRAYDLVGLDAGTTPPGDAMLRFTLFGKSLESRVGLSGLHVGVK